MCDGEALRYQRRRMMVRIKWAFLTPSRVVPQELFHLLPQQYAGAGFFIYVIN
jgi:hypothetical protein